MNMTEVNADTEKCVGGGQCVLVAPGVFDQDDDGIVTVLRGPGTGELAAVREAVTLCPGGALTLLGATAGNGTERG